MQSGTVPSPQMLTLFHAFSTALHRETTLPELLQSLVMRSVQLIPQAAAGCFIAYDAANHTFEIQHSHGYAFPSLFRDLSFADDCIRLTEIVKTHFHTIIEHHDKIEWLPGQLQSTYTECNNGLLPMESILLPVHDPQQLLGVLVIERFAGEAFQTSDAELLGNFTRQATLAIHKVELYQENVMITQALDEELQSVGRVQQDLLPKELPELKGIDWFTYYKPATRAGGDYYDFIPLADGRWAVLMADVTGHGAPAAVIAAMIKVILHTLLETITEPDRILEEANRQIRKHIDSQYFVTLFLGILNPDTFDLVYVSAGHDPPIRFMAASLEMEELKNNKGFPLRMVEQNRFDVQQTQLLPGDMVVIYTDGVTEMFNEEDKVFSFTGLQNAILSANHTSAESLGESVLATLETFRGNAEIHDDVTLIVMQIQEHG